MDVARQRGHEANLRNVRLMVEHGLAQMRHAPALGNVEVEKLRQLLCRLGGHGVAPGAEGHEQPILRVEGQIAVHHGAHADGSDGGQLRAIALSNVLRQRGVAGLKAADHVLHGVSPHAVLQPVFPCAAAGGQQLVLLVDQHGLDARGAQLDSENGSSLFDDRSLIQNIHPPFSIK